ncbi:Uncharacterised protein [Pseudescherichia vulneris]|nr:Uncharacterised protein [Pseudescherichia vulneris]
MVILKVAHSLLKLVWFIALFCFVSWMDVRYFSEHPMISNVTAIKIAYWFSSKPAPEDIYFSYDYVLIFFNFLSSIILYFIIVKLVNTVRRK